MKTSAINFLKIIFVGIILFISLGRIEAQNITLQDVTRNGFKGIKKMDNTGYYIQYVQSVIDGKKTKKVMKLVVLDNSLQKTGDFPIDLKANESIEDVAYNGGNFMIIVSSAMDKTKMYKLLDKAGKEVTKKEFTNVNRRLLEKPSVIIPVDAADFIVLNYVKEKKRGYSVERYNAKLEEKFNETYVPEKKMLFPADYSISGNILFVLEFISSDWSDFFEYHIVGYDITNGKQLFTNNLTSADGKAFGYATFIKAAPQGGVITGGMYFDDNEIKGSNSDGFFGASVDGKGKMNFTYKKWKDVQGKIEDKGHGFGWGGVTKTFMHDVVVKNDGSYTLIGENFRKGDADLAGGTNKTLGALSHVGKLTGNSNEPSETAVTVSEFTLLDFDAKNNFSGVRKLAKPTSVTVIKNTDDANDLPFLGQRKGLNLTNILNNNGYLPYRFTALKGDQQVMVYWARYDKMYLERLYFTKLSAANTDTTSLEVTNSMLKVQQDLDAGITKKMGKLGKLSKKMDAVSGENIQNDFFLRGSMDPTDYRSKDINTRVLPSNMPGKVIMYDFTPKDAESDDTEKKKGLLKSYAAGMNAAASGNLKIWYLDIP